MSIVDDVDYVDPRMMRGKWQSGYTRNVHGNLREIPFARAWSAEDYELLEKLGGLGLSSNEMRRYFTPTPTRESIRGALIRAGIAHGRGRGQPSRVERTRWDAIWIKWQNGEL